MDFSASLFKRILAVGFACALASLLLAAPALARNAYTVNYDNNSVSVIDTTTNQVVGIPIPVGELPYTDAITPDGRYVYVGNEKSEDISVIDTTTNQVIKTIPLAAQPAVIAISPDGKTAYVTEQETNKVDVIEIATNQLLVPIEVGVGQNWGVIFTPNGRFAYVASYEDDLVYVVDTQTHQVVGNPIPAGESPYNLAVTPDGRYVYVTDNGSNEVSVIDTQTQTNVGNVKVGESPWEVAIAPDGSKAYVTNEDSNDVSVIDTQTRQLLGNPIPVGGEPYGVAVTPNGAAAYVADYETKTISVISTQTNTVTATIPMTGLGAWLIAITPDQSPTASFKASGLTAGSPTQLNAAGSTDPDGLVASYSWIFGDGKKATTKKAKISHAYKKAKTFKPSLTVSDEEGCSTALVFTGRTASCTGSAGATATKALKLKAPNNFKLGKLKKNAASGSAKLAVKLPYAGSVKLWGKGVRTVKRHLGKAKTLTLTVAPLAGLKAQLAATGAAKAKVRVKFKPDGGKARTKTRSLQLVQR
jgi:YVTN family beta-propeller protein